MVVRDRHRFVAIGAIVAGPLVVLGGCSLVAHLGDYAVGTSPTDGSVIGVDGTTLEDCGATSPRSIFTTSCTTSTCVPFDDDAHITSGLQDDGGLPPLPDAASTGGTGATDAAKSEEAGTGGSTDASSDASSDAAPAPADDAGPAYPPCSSLPNPVYMMGSNPLLPIVQQLGTWANGVGITLVYTQLSSCKGVSAVVQNADAITSGATISNYWDTGSNTLTCSIDDASKYADIGLSSVFMQTCIPTTTGFSGVADFQGPIVTAVFFVPHSSDQTSLSAEAAYLLYSGAGKVTPWNDRSYVFLRGATGGTQVMMGIAIGVPAAQWVGVTTNSSEVERSDVIASTSPENTLGLGEIDYAEDATGTPNLNELAFRAYGQDCAYYPNSTVSSHDKRNVRDGHYVGWGPAHLVTRVNAQGVPVSAAAGQIIDYFIGNTPVPNHDFLSVVITDHLVPQCAMKVHRTQEMGPPLPYAPTPSCSCFFDSVVGETTCTTCTTSQECPQSAPVCNLGYCEPQ